MHIPEIVSRFILHTRSVEYGKGEWHIAYVILFKWIMMNHDLTAIQSLDPSSIYIQCLFDMTKVGSWKDIVYFAEYVLEQTRKPHHPIIATCIQLVNDQLAMDVKHAKNDTHSISHVSKWIPREKSKLGWLFYLLAYDWTLRHKPYYYKYATTLSQKESAIRKSLKEYRILVSQLSNESIKHSPTRKLIQSVDYYVKQSMEILQIKTRTETDYSLDDTTYQTRMYDIHQRIYFLQNSWERYVNIVSKRETIVHVLPVIDISRTMYTDNQFALLSSIGMACVLCQKTIPSKRRILTIDYHPSWIDLSHCNNIVEMVDTIFRSSRGNTVANVSNTLRMLQSAFHASEYTSESLDVILFSNMNWLSDPSFIDTMSEPVFTERNVKFILWKISHDSSETNHVIDIPDALQESKRISMYSGVSPTLCIRMLEKRHFYPSLREQTPYESIMQMIFAPDI